MKKLLLLFVLVTCFSVTAQTDYYPIITGLSTSGNGRAPQGSQRYVRSVWLITATEMAAAGFTTGSVINSLGFNYLVAQNITTTGNMIVYLQNTTETTNSKNATWTTAITGMTTASNASITIPAAVGTVDFSFSGGTTFTYTGGGLYIAFDYANAAGTLSTANTAACNTALTGGIKSAVSTASAPPTLNAASNFRPETRLGKSVLCARPTLLGATANYTATSAELTWTSSGGTVDFEFGPYGYTQGTGTSSIAVTSPYIKTGLTANTAYDYYVRKNCGAGIYSAWSGPYAFHTTFSPANPTYNTGFEFDDFPLFGWSADNVVGAWYPNYDGTSALAQEGFYAAASVIGVTTAVADARMYSRGVNLQAGTTATITYYDRNFVSGSTNTSSYNLTVGSAQTAASQTTNIAAVTGLASTTFALKTYTFTPTSAGVYYFSFQNVSPINAAGTHALLIDNFTVTQALSTDSFLDNKFVVSPNPTKDLLNVTNDENININEIIIADLNGRVVKNNKFNDVLNVQVNVSDLSTGMYMMQIKSDLGSSTKKIIKE